MRLDAFVLLVSRPALLLLAPGCADDDPGASGGGAGSPTVGTAGTAAGSAGKGGRPACTPPDSSGAGGAVYIAAKAPPDGEPCVVEGLEVCTHETPAPSSDQERTLSRCQDGVWTTVESPSTCDAVQVDCNKGFSSSGQPTIQENVCCTTVVYCEGERAVCDGTRWRKDPPAAP